MSFHAPPDNPPETRLKVSRVPKWGYGSKRRIRMIHWNAYEIAGLVLLAFALMAFGFWLARWLAALEMHERDEHETALNTRVPRPGLLDAFRNHRLTVHVGD